MVKRKVCLLVKGRVEVAEAELRSQLSGADVVVGRLLLVRQNSMIYQHR
jgi:hypothetical protein